eukprot:scaffold537_cov180-Ochromonas_danica.AAC.14
MTSPVEDDIILDLDLEVDSQAIAAMKASASPQPVRGKEWRIREHLTSLSLGHVTQISPSPPLSSPLLPSLSLPSLCIALQLAYIR